MEIGFVINNRYVIKSLLGTGGMGDVYLVKEVKLESLWAMKRISKDSRLKVDYKKELEILKKLNHNSLPRIFDFFEDVEFLYIILDYFEGPTLDNYQINKGINIEKALNIIKQICDVMIYLHEQKPNPIIYRDIKPSNIIIVNNDNVKLIDFGIAREFKLEKENDTVNIGTRGYAAPEQYGWGQTDTRTDIFSIGIIFYQLITGISPNTEDFKISEDFMRLKEIPEKIQKIIIKSTEPKPSNRYQTVRELLYNINESDFKSRKMQVKKILVIPNDYKKVILLLGSEGSGTSTVVKAISEYFGDKKKRVGIVDITSDNKLYKRIGLRQDKIFPSKTELSKDGIKNILEGKMAATVVDKDTKLFLSDTKLSLSEEEIISLIDILKSNNDIVIFMSDLNCNSSYLKHMTDIYFIKDMSPYNCFKYNDFLKSKIKNENYHEKIKFIINKTLKSKVSPIDIKNTCCENIFINNEIKTYQIPFEIDNARIALENEKQEGFTCRNFTKAFKKSIEAIANGIYPVKR